MCRLYVVIFVVVVAAAAAVDDKRNSWTAVAAPDNHVVTHLNA